MHLLLVYYYHSRFHTQYIISGVRTYTTLVTVLETRVYILYMTIGQSLIFVRYFLVTNITMTMSIHFLISLQTSTVLFQVFYSTEKIIFKPHNSFFIYI